MPKTLWAMARFTDSTEAMEGIREPDIDLRFSQPIPCGYRVPTTNSTSRTTRDQTQVLHPADTWTAPSTWPWSTSGNHAAGNLARFVESNLANDPAYHSAVGTYGQLHRISEPVEPNFLKATSNNINTRAPYIPHSNPPVTAVEPPLYQYYHRDPYQQEGQYETPIPHHQDGMYIPHGPPNPHTVTSLESIADNELSPISLEPAYGWVAQSPAGLEVVCKKEEVEIRRNPQPCFECCFAKVGKDKCMGFPGKPCTRCALLLTRLRKPLQGTDQSPGFITMILFFDIQTVHKLLSSLLAEAKGLMTSSTETEMDEFPFDKPIICHMASDKGGIGASLAGDSHQVVMTHLATGKKQGAEFDSASTETRPRFPSPGLNRAQLDTFIVIGNRMQRLNTLSKIDKDIISAALKISDHMGILFNWDANMVAFDNALTQRFGVAEFNKSAAKTVTLAKMIVVETVYSIVHRVQELMTVICHEVNQSFMQPRHSSHDPATISCALWIMYSSLRTFRKLKWRHTSMVHLKTFLNGMRDRSTEAITAIECYRKDYAFSYCGKHSANQDAFRELIVAQKHPKRAIAFAYEQFNDSPMFARLPTYSSELSYTDVLEARAQTTDSLAAYYVSEPMGNTCEAEHPGSKTTLAQLREMNHEARSGHEEEECRSDISFTGSSESTIDPRQRKPTLSTLPMGDTCEDESKFQLDARIQRAEQRLQYLKQKKQTPRYNATAMPQDQDMHDDWIADGKKTPDWLVPE